MNGSVAVVTGASRNLGAAIAEKLARDGFRVAINYHSDGSGEDVQALISKIENAGGLAKGYKFDVANETEVKDFFARVKLELGNTQVLVNNAAGSVASRAGYHEIDVSEWDSVMATNLRGMYLCSREAIPSMVEIGTGSIINISSVRALLGLKGNIHYTTSKAGQIGFTKVLARELGEKNIRVNSLVVGAIKTPDEAVYGDEAEIDAQMFGLQALRRRGLPVDVANAVSFFASPMSDFITGQSLVVDGGWVMD